MNSLVTEDLGHLLEELYRTSSSELHGWLSMNPEELYLAMPKMFIDVFNMMNFYNVVTCGSALAFATRVPHYEWSFVLYHPDGLAWGDNDLINTIYIADPYGS